MASLVDRLRRALDPVDSERSAPAAARRSAAVLLLFDARNPTLPLLFLERTPHLRHHAGQIGFPGGGREPGDSSVVDTALREAAEETGVPRDAVEVLGLLPPFLTATSDNWLTPVVGLQHTDIALTGDPFEVARLFHVGFRALMTSPHSVRTVLHEGVEREVHYYEVNGTVIWGVTAAIVTELIIRLANIN